MKESKYEKVQKRIRNGKTIEACAAECDDIEHLCGKEFADMWRLLYGLIQEEQ